MYDAWTRTKEVRNEGARGCAGWRGIKGGKWETIIA